MRNSVFGEARRSTRVACKVLPQSRRVRTPIRFEAIGPYVQVGPVVADIVEAALAEGFDQKTRLVRTRKVGDRIRAEPAGEEPEMLGDDRDEACIASRRDVDRPTGASRHHEYF